MTTAMLNPAQQQRRDWMAVLAQAPRERLMQLAAPWRAGRNFETLRAPECGLVMLRGRAGGSGERFNLGEATLSRCVVRLASAQGQTLGVGYRLGRDEARVRCMAELDALLQQADTQAELLATLIEPLRAEIARAREAEQQRHAASRVRFFTLAAENE